MSVARSLALWLTSSGAVLLGTHGYLQLRSEARALDEGARRELALVTASIQAAVEAALRDQQHPDVVALFTKLEVRDPSLDIFLFDAAGQLAVHLGGTMGSHSTPVPGTLPLGSPHRVNGALALRVPIRPRHEDTHELVLVRSLAALTSDLEAERAATVQSIVLLGMALAGVTSLVLHFRLHRPVQALQGGIQRVAAGDLSYRLHSCGRDELAELGRELDRMTEALERARDGLAAETQRRQNLEQEIERVHRLVVVGELAAVLAHEIGSPLQVLQGRAKMLADMPDLPDGPRRNAEVIAEQTTRVTAIVEQLLDVARRRAPRFEPLDPVEPARVVVEFLEPHARRAGVRIETSLSPTSPVRADGTQLQQVVLNLVQNAVRAAGSGGVVRVEATRDPEGPVPQVVLAVVDSGPGVDADLRSRVFEPFASFWPRGSTGTSTGLGLSVVRSIVADHGGSLEVTDGAAWGLSGAAFLVRLPVPEPSTSSVSARGELEG